MDIKWIYVIIISCCIVSPVISGCLSYTHKQGTEDSLTEMCIVALVSGLSIENNYSCRIDSIFYFRDRIKRHNTVHGQAEIITQKGGRNKIVIKNNWFGLAVFFLLLIFLMSSPSPGPIITRTRRRETSDWELKSLYLLLTVCWTIPCLRCDIKTNVYVNKKNSKLHSQIRERMRKKMKRDKWSLRPIYKLDAMVKIEGEENKKKTTICEFHKVSMRYTSESDSTTGYMTKIIS